MVRTTHADSSQSNRSHMRKRGERHLEKRVDTVTSRSYNGRVAQQRVQLDSKLGADRNSDG